MFFSPKVIQASLAVATWIAISSPMVAGAADLGYLTPNEREWLSEHRRGIRVAPEANYPPFSFVEADGVWRGLSADVVRFLEEILGIELSILAPGDLAPFIEKAKRGEVDVITSLKKTPERSAFLFFTQPYVAVPTVIIAAAGSEPGSSPGSLGGEEGRCRQGLRCPGIPAKSFS